MRERGFESIFKSIAVNSPKVISLQDCTKAKKCSQSFNDPQIEEMKCKMQFENGRRDNSSDDTLSNDNSTIEIETYLGHLM